MSLFPRVRSVLPAALACVALAAAAPPARDPGSGTSAGIRHRNDAVEATTQAPFGKEPVRREADEPVPHLRTHPGLEATLFAEGARLFPMPALQGDETVPLVTDLLPRSGDPRRGEQVFEAVGCRECHVIDGAGTSFGPDLSRIGDKLSKVGLYESILDPSGGISPSYALYDLTLRDGREVSGFIVSETADAVTLHMQAGVVSDFARSEVLARRASPLSAMPSDLQRQMTVDDLVDLVEYMATLR